jgi:hypothetical protein
MQNNEKNGTAGRNSNFEELFEAIYFYSEI